MTLINTTDLADIRADFELTLFDTCVIGAPTAGAFGAATVKASAFAYTADAIACGVKNVLPKESQDGAEATLADVVIRVPMGAVVATGNRVKVTHRHAEALAAAEYYAVLGTPFNGLGFISLNCRRLTGTSAA